MAALNGFGDVWRTLHHQNRPEQSRHQHLVWQASAEQFATQQQQIPKRENTKLSQSQYCPKMSCQGGKSQRTSAESRQEGCIDWAAQVAFDSGPAAFASRIPLPQAGATNRWLNWIDACALKTTRFSPLVVTEVSPKRPCSAQESSPDALRSPGRMNISARWLF